MSSSSLNHPLSLLTSFLLLFIFSGDFLSVAGTLTPVISKLTAPPSPRILNRAKRNRDISEYLNAHNLARVATGASSLKWDKGLARFASNWAKQRKNDCKMTHSGGPYGENIFWYQKSENWTPRRVVAKWVEESSNYNPITNTCAYSKMCGHYTQIIWRGTTAVGCAHAMCDNGRGFLAVCEYSPQGNYEGESPFDLP